HPGRCRPGSARSPRSSVVSAGSAARCDGSGGRSPVAWWSGAAPTPRDGSCRAVLVRWRHAVLLQHPVLDRDEVRAGLVRLVQLLAQSGHLVHEVLDNGDPAALQRREEGGDSQLFGGHRGGPYIISPRSDTTCARLHMMSIPYRVCCHLGWEVLCPWYTWRNEKAPAPLERPGAWHQVLGALNALQEYHPLRLLSLRLRRDNTYIQVHRREARDQEG